MMTKEQARLALTMFAPDAMNAKPVVYVAVTHRAKSGLSRRVRVYCAPSAHDIRDVTGIAALACDFRANKQTGEIIVSGCGFNVAQHVAEHIASAIGATKLDYRYL